MSNLSFVEHLGNGTSKQFTIAVAGENIGYFRTTDIKAYVDDVEVTFTINNASPHIAVFDVAPPIGTKIIIRRAMPLKSTYANFERGNNFGHRQVNNTFLQQLYLTQELFDGFTPAGFYMKQDLSMGNRKITDVKDAELETDAINLKQLSAVDAVNDQWNKEQDVRLTDLEHAIPVSPAYIANYSYTAKGGELSLDTNYTFGYAILAINSNLQSFGKAFNILGSTLVFAEPLEEDDEVFAILTVPFATQPVFEGMGDWIYTAVGGEMVVDTSLAFRAIILTLNGSTQIPTRAFSYTGTVLHFAEPLAEDDELYGILIS